jgi:RNA polymerase sigma factor (sigma-70 family)
MRKKEILEKFRANDTIAWTKIYEIFYRTLWYYILRYVSNRSDAEELLNDVFLKIKDNCNGIETMDQLKAKLIVIAKNLIIDYSRRQKTRKNIKTEEYDSIEESLNDHERNKFYERNVEQAELILQEIYKQPEQRKTVVLLFWEGFTANEIAGKLGISESTVYNHRLAAKKDLKEKLGDQFNNYGLLLLLIFLLQTLFH